MRRFGFWMSVLWMSILLGCSQAEVKDGEEDHQPIGAIKNKIEQTSYGEDIGFQLESPTYKTNEIASSLTVKGKVEEADDLIDPYMWIVITGNSDVSFEYYVPIENGEFQEKIMVHEGDGVYEVSVRAPSNEQENKDEYYDVATFSVKNTDTEKKRDVAYTKFGVQQGMHMDHPSEGMNVVDETILLEGTVPENYASDMILVNIEKEHEEEQLMLPVHDQSFASEIPLYFGTGIHKISVQLYNDADDYFYESAVIYAENQTEEAFAEVYTYTEASTYGVELESPSYASKKYVEDESFEIKGKIDTSQPHATDITHVITNVYSYEEEEEASYIAPVVDGEFAGDVFFRFGPGEYEVQVMIPDLENRDEDIQYFQTITHAYFEVDGVEDNRDLLPSQGVESDNLSIVERAEKITQGISSEREKARAIYAFVAQNVAYDVEKFETEDSFTRLYDSGLEALETGKGVCQDYAYLAIALFRSLGMEAHYIVGQAGELHAWVEVKVDGEWLEMDPTWGAGYVENGVFHFQYDERYFDPDPEFFAETHTREEVRY